MDIFHWPSVWRSTPTAHSLYRHPTSSAFISRWLLPSVWPWRHSRQQTLSCWSRLCFYYPCRRLRFLKMSHRKTWKSWTFRSHLKRMFRSSTLAICASLASIFQNFGHQALKSRQFGSEFRPLEWSWNCSHWRCYVDLAPLFCLGKA